VPDADVLIDGVAADDGRDASEEKKYRFCSTE
jgi:hypothetical protein